MAATPQPFFPQLAVSAAIVRDGRVLVMRRARDPARRLFTLPGGRVEPGETLIEATLREVREETALTVEIAGLAGYHDSIVRDAAGTLVQHYVIVVFAARWLSGEVVPCDEHDAFRWIEPAELAGLATTDNLAAIVARAYAVLGI
ncbi:MAG: NUDIX domain-containing protein [Xanthobacteraceae bacterium]|nr:MAG: NUDIX domain-containing protein [Xanthobacteraceae bacterium]